MSHRSCAGLLSLALLAPPSIGQAAKVTKDTVPGITNFARLETTVACGGATKSGRRAAIKKLGFASIINLREASEPGADIEEEAAAAKAAGLHFVQRPVQHRGARARSRRSLSRRGHQAREPTAFIHCAAGGRAAACG